ncbi:MAG TPA: bifunctional diaminohydroxyphosphoribosylaminopyrimidine deaminase/5-amino-6-(5-phosphoribosylamino)uracil reductase RibD [Anaeromyxobacter sp.]
MSTAEDARWMARALDLARRGLGETNPNPVVGCVLVKRGRVVGEGWHRRAGGPHAEVLALRAAGAAARGATAYVTLEPCAHQGRTPPCAPAVVASGVRRVVAALRDPNPAVNGRGLAALRRAGLEVTAGVAADEAVALNERFVVAAGLTRPFVMLKAAMTLDGRIATAAGESKWITRPAQRRRARALRRLHDGVAVGVGTVLADDPLLLPAPRTRRPFHRVVFDSRLRTPLRSRLVSSASDQAPLWIVTTEEALGREALEARGVRILAAPAREGRVDLEWGLQALRAEGLWSLMVEGGSELLGALLAARLFDQVALFRAPLILGGRHTRPAFGGPDPARLADAVRVTPYSPLLPARSKAVSPAVPEAGPYEIWYPAGVRYGRTR